MNETQDLAQQPHDEVAAAIAERLGETDEHCMVLFERNRSLVIQEA